MDRLEAMSIVLAVAEAGSLSAAARRLARDAGVTSGGRADIRAHPGADQPGSRTGHERVAKEQGLIMPDDVRFTAAATLRRSPSFRLSNSSRRRGKG
jgi:hypothetical protein